MDKNKDKKGFKNYKNQSQQLLIVSNKNNKKLKREKTTNILIHDKEIFKKYFLNLKNRNFEDNSLTLSNNYKNLSNKADNTKTNFNRITF